MTFLDTWKTQTALDDTSMFPLVRAFTVAIAATAIKADATVVATLKDLALNQHVENGKGTFHQEAPYYQANDLLFKPFSQPYQLGDWVLIGNGGSTRQLFVRVNYTRMPNGKSATISEVVVGVRWKSQANSAALKDAAEKAWAPLGVTGGDLPPNTGDRFAWGKQWQHLDWTDTEDLLIKQVGDLVVALLPLVTPPAPSTVLPAVKISEYLATRGYKYAPRRLATFYGALKAKGFVILSGLSGTGKTKLVQEFVRYLGLDDDDHFLIEPVRPDWRDNSGLLGYWNPVTRSYHATNFLRLILKANEEYQRQQQTVLVAPGLIPYLKARLEETAVQNAIAACQAALDDIASSTAAKSWSEDQIRALWRECDNGVRALDIAPNLADLITDSVLEQATNELLDTTKTIGKRAGAALGYLEAAGETSVHHIRMARAFAMLHPTVGSPVAERRELMAVCKALGLAISIPPLPIENRWDAMAAAWAQMRTKVTQLLVQLGLTASPVGVGLVVDTLLADFVREHPGALNLMTPSATIGVAGTSAIAAKPFVLVLDEMNLARVEYYMADILSVMETGREEHGPQMGYTRGQIHLHSQSERVTLTDGTVIPRSISLPPNLYIVGTVNVDETTFTFSHKVLDRAFTLESNEVNLSDYPPAPSAASVTASPELVATMLVDFCQQGRFAWSTKSDVAEWGQRFGPLIQQLADLNTRLRDHYLQFGYRVVDEVLAFIAALADSPLAGSLTEESAFDSATMMKVLPKISGPKHKVEKGLKAIEQWAGPAGAPKFPITFAKVKEMLDRADKTGYTTYS